MRLSTRIIVTAILAVISISCQKRDNGKPDIEKEYLLTGNTCLTINGEAAETGDFPDASVSFEQVSDDLTILKVKNLILGHPEVSALCSSLPRCKASGSTFFDSRSNYDEIMDIRIKGEVNSRQLLQLSISTEYDYGIVGKWELTRIRFGQEDLRTPEHLLTLTENGRVQTVPRLRHFDGTMEYYVSDRTKTLYVHLRNSCIRPVIGAIRQNERLARLFDSLNLDARLDEIFNVTFPIRFEIQGTESKRNLYLYLDHESIAPYLTLVEPSAGTLLVFLEELDYGELDTDLDREAFETLRKTMISFLNLVVNGEKNYKVEAKYTIRNV